MSEILLPLYGGRPSLAPVAAAIRYDDGFYEEEQEDAEVYRWMSQSGLISFTPQDDERFLELAVFCEIGDLSQTLEASSGRYEETFELVHGWAPLSFKVPPGADHIDLATNKLFPGAYYPTDRRRLAVRVRRPLLHTDPERHRHIRRQGSNAVVNTQEMLEGKTVLSSTPPNLGLDLHGACNVKPPCVYCEWDESKKKEGDHVDVPFTVQTLEEYGDFFGNAAKLFNCAIGEPFMMRNLDELLDAFGDQGKALEMSTNGQLLTERNVEKLLGRNIELYISLDAATPETYSRLRNNTFEKILNNIRRLVRARGRDGSLPKIFLVFMPLRANIHELDAFVELCANLGVDKLILRPLNTMMGPDLDWERGGYHFLYSRELLPLDELARIGGRAAEQCRRLGVELSNQLDFGGSLESDFAEEFSRGREDVADSAPAIESTPPEPTSRPQEAWPEEDAGDGGALPSLGMEKWPPCTEPWRNFYLLRRGVLPCSYGHTPIAAMGEHGEAWNSPLMQEIRSHLARGSFHRYCLKSSTCPIVQKSSHLHRIPVPQRMLLWSWRCWDALNSLTGGVPRRLVHRIRRDPALPNRISPES